MTPHQFLDAILTYCQETHASITSFYRTPAHNRAAGGVPDSLHLKALAADVVYDARPEHPLRQATAMTLGLLLIEEEDHDHLQPRTIPKG